MTDLDARRGRHEALCARLGGLSDDELTTLLASAEWRRGWGETAVIEVDGQRTFVKKIPLADLERAPGQEGSTANHFGLPLFYQYGVGSGGFGAWRELAAMRRASDWALAGDCELFPIIHHWRVLPERSETIASMAERVDGMVVYWNQSQAVRARLEGMLAATAAIIVVMEYAPESLHDWLRRVIEEGQTGPKTQTLIVTLARQLHEAQAFMTARGMLHFDLHGHNLLTDGERLYVCDFGLALCDDFDLSAEERAFFEAHRLYDCAYVEAALAWWLTQPRDTPPPPDLTPAIRAVIDPGRRIAGIMGDFLAKVREDKATPYPGPALAAAIAGQ